MSFLTCFFVGPLKYLTATILGIITGLLTAKAQYWQFLNVPLAFIVLASPIAIFLASSESAMSRLRQVIYAFILFGCGMQAFEGIGRNVLLSKSEKEDYQSQQIKKIELEKQKDAEAKHRKIERKKEIAKNPPMDELTLLRKTYEEFRSNNKNSSTKQPVAKQSRKASLVTYENYLKLTSGMTYQQVNDILGVEGVEMSRIGSYDNNVAMYSWSGRGLSNVVASFENGFMYEKAQFGLK